MAADDTGAARYIRTEINFGDGPLRLDLSLDEETRWRPVDEAMIRRIFARLRDDALAHFLKTTSAKEDNAI